MRTLLAIAIVGAGLFLSPYAGDGGEGQPCEVVPMPCTFEGLPFKLKVIDAETRQPIADVHAMAEWQTEGVGGRLNGPLVVLDAVSGADGGLGFPGWGPIHGPVMGIAVGRDPILTFFKAGYRALVVNNKYLPPARERERVRRFGQDDVTYALQPFRGAPDDWIQELRTVYRGVTFPRDDEQSLQFRGPYLNRLRRVWAERTSVPESHLKRPGFFWFVSNSMKDLEGVQ